MERRAPRYAHAEGHTYLIYSPDGKELLTCGSDGDVRIWADLDDDDPRSVCVGEWALSILLKNERLYVSTDKHTLQIYTYPSFDKDGIVTRSTAPITHVVAPPQDSGIICCSESMESHYCQKVDNKWVSKTMLHQGPVLGVAICPMGKYSITSCGDGLYRIWNLEDLTIIKEIPGIPKVNSFYAAKVLGRACFDPNGKLLAYPMLKEIIILDTRNWQQKFTLNNSQINSTLSICLFSPCGSYLAASTITGQIIVWNILEQNILGVTEHPNSFNISSLAWNPTGNGELAFCDFSGQLATIINCYVDKVSEVEENEDDLDLIDIIEKEEITKNGELQDDDDYNDDDEDDENTISLKKLKRETLGTGKDIVINEKSLSPPPESRPHSRNLQHENVPAQLPFQPSSTPTNLDHRYMCWNDIGIVRCHTINDNSNIEVEFHDVSVHHSIHLNNHLNHTMASLSTSVLILACEAPSKIVCIAFLGGSKEWNISLADIEEVLCVTTTNKVVAIATSLRFLRFYTLCGTQLHVLSLLGPPLCIAGNENKIGVIYHASDPGMHDQHLAMDIIRIQGISITCFRTRIPVALSQGAQVRWFGFTEKSSPVLLDSFGMLRLYDISSNFWIPICNTADYYKGVSDSHFIISVNESDQKINAVLCRGTHFPPTAPRPIVTHLPMRLPLCEMETEKSQQEEQLRLGAVLHIGQSQVETVLKLFALACRSEIEHRAIELIELFQDQQIASLAIRYASRLGKVHLADKLSNLADSWKENIDCDMNIENFDEEIQNPPNILLENLNESPVQPISKKVSDTPTFKPIPILKSSQGIKNPFRLSNANRSIQKNSTSNPLSLTERNFISKDEYMADSPMLTVESPHSSEMFPQWYERNEKALSIQYSDLTPTELTKMGIRTFKQFRSQESTNSSEEISTKRKHSPESTRSDNNKDIISTPKQSKLGAFAFHKRDK